MSASVLVIQLQKLHSRPGFVLFTCATAIVVRGELVLLHTAYQLLSFLIE
jgi:hypothetical protein